ncbi:hypothetical protein F7734_31390 [Scytonema sp. UIC 10036]|uniref:hypothetical protein n=1 Tax=Scytonema sp. UIC 10036 TaxID=2304196 RepID=UPI0012DAD3F8|nr:hypothetical protein [Scytonema sp. UIC 10036]MUG96599.1 hypothetical protein [Scytonema sp. UIC 10036]
MNKILLLAILFSTTLTSYSHTVSAMNLPTIVVSQAMKPSPNQNIEIQSVTLLAKEQKNSPIGQPPTSNRDIGFASVFFRLSNTVEKDSKITILSIKIVNVKDEQLQDFAYSQKEITLRPLQNSEIPFYLTNKTGYLGSDKVKAVITYQIGNQIRFVESEPVTVERY